MHLDPDLIRPDELNEFHAALNVHGLYNTEQFVLRLSPKNHQLIDAITDTHFDHTSVSSETLQAYSTYLHETIHWWQHIGSTTGLLLSTCFPNQTHMNAHEIAEWCTLTKPTKPIKKWALNGEINGNTHKDRAQALGNIITNNFMDIHNFKLWILRPDLSQKIYEDRYFESQGHCFHLAYNGLLSNIQPIIDPNSNFLPSVNNWAEQFISLSEQKQQGYYYGSPIIGRKVSLIELWEGQTCFNQMQFLSCVTNNTKLEDFRDAGMLHGVYEAAFIKFLKLSKLQMPTLATDPIVGLFLLVVDLAINPTEGFPCDISDFPNFVYQADPNIRFEMICTAIADNPNEFSIAINEYSNEEYWEISQKLADRCGITHIAKGWDEVQKWRSTFPEVAALMKEKELFQFQNSNMPLRVLLSFFIDFTSDKAICPEFFCWPGFWKSNHPKKVEKLWLKNLSLFSDKAADGGIFIREFPNKEKSDLLNTLNVFFANSIIYNLSRQFIHEEGSFNFSFRWLSGKHTETYWKEFAEKEFKHLYGVGLSEISY